MRAARVFALAVALAVCLLAALPIPGARTAEPPARVVMVSIDGLMPAYYLKAAEMGLKVPNLRRLMEDGAYARGVVGVVPSVTYPSHTTLITGVPPRIHGIAANTVFDPEGRSGGAWEWFASAIRVPTLVSAARARSLRTATVSWPVSLGIGSDWNLPEFWRPGSQHPVDLKLLGLVSTA
jgi:predicted AlkP superfamily pyrophosphatase or phosphodiesterase